MGLFDAIFGTQQNFGDDMRKMADAQLAQMRAHPLGIPGSVGSGLHYSPLWQVGPPIKDARAERMAARRAERRAARRSIGRKGRR